MSNKQSTVVVDASIAIKWALSEIDSRLAEALLDDWTKQGLIIFAPDLLLYEITNVLYKRMRRKELTLEEAAYAFSLLMGANLNFEVVTDQNLSLRALDFAYTHKLPATYDAHYLALAEREQCEFWTADERLYNSVKDQLSWVRFMAADASASTPA